MTSQIEKCASKFVFMMPIAWLESTVRKMFAGQAVGRIPIAHSDKFAGRDQKNLHESVKRAVTSVTIVQSDR